MAQTADRWDTANNREAEQGIDSPRGDGGSAGSRDNPSWLQLARSAYQASDQWLQANQRNIWEEAYRAFNNQHPSGSKYYSDAFKHRSKLFRPKTRASVRKSEAACAAAFFATQDMVSVEARNDAQQQQQASAAINEALLNYRLDRNPINWFMILQGGFQDTQVVGVAIAHAYWHYEEQQTGTREVNKVGPFGNPLIDENGQYVTEEEPVVEVVRDEPQIELKKPENVRIDPNADWMDPINSSPYVIDLIPMYVVDAKQRMKVEDPKTGAPEWYDVDDKTLQQARTEEYNSVSQSREGYRSDQQGNDSPVRDYDTVWIHRNIVRWDGEDYIYYTVGTQAMLTDPKPLKEAYFHGERPYVMGYALIEAHKPYPASAVQLTQPLQREVNEITNQRIDNVRLAMNPRYFYRQGRNVDLAALKNSVPGGPVGMQNPQEDIYVDRPQDVTRSSYEEQDRLANEFDELAGTFSQSSVQSNREVGETVGGMNLLAQSANLLQDYDLRVFAETFVEPLLRQLVKLEQAYETDRNILSLAGQKAQLYQRFGINEVTDELLREDVTVRVNVGIGNTDPMQRLQKFQMGAQTVGNILGEGVQTHVNAEEVVKEVFGTLGYKDGARFFNWGDSDPQYAMLQQRLQEAEAQIQSDQAERQHELQKERMQQKHDIRKERMQNAADFLQTVLKTGGDVRKEKLQTADRVWEALVNSDLRRQENAEQGERDMQREAMRGQQQADRQQGGGSTANQ